MQPTCMGMGMMVALVQVSMHHARLFKESGDYYVSDLGSAQGTWLNGARLAVQRKQKVTPGDEITVGRRGLEDLTFKVKMVHPSVWEQVQAADTSEMDAPAEAVTA